MRKRPRPARETGIRTWAVIGETTGYRSAAANRVGTGLGALARAYRLKWVRQRAHT
jgi:hypothetical protein